MYNLKGKIRSIDHINDKIIIVVIDQYQSKFNSETKKNEPVYVPIAVKCFGKLKDKILERYDATDFISINFALDSNFHNGKYYTEVILKELCNSGYMPKKRDNQGGNIADNDDIMDDLPF